MTRPAILLDRDGTLSREQGFITAAEQLTVLPGVPEALGRAAAAGYLLVVVTNQSGIARGLYDERELSRIHAALHPELGGLPRAYLHCPHHPDPQFAASGYGRTCDCRKPGSGLLHQADRLFGIDWQASYVIGDAARDLRAGRGMASRKILLQSGKRWESELAKLLSADCRPDHVAADLGAAVDWILS